MATTNITITDDTATGGHVVVTASGENGPYLDTPQTWSVDRTAGGFTERVIPLRVATVAQITDDCRHIACRWAALQRSSPSVP